MSGKKEKNGSLKKETYSTTRGTMGKVLRYIRRYWFFVALSILCAAITVALTLYVPILTGDAIDYIIDKGLVNFDPVLSIVKKIVVVVLLTAVSQWMMNVSNNRIAYHVIHDIRREAFHKIEILPLKYIDGHSYGEVVSRVIADVDQFSDGLLMGFTQLFTGVITILGTLLFMISLNGKITLVVVLVTPVSLFVAAFIAKKTYSMFKLQSETRGEQTALIDEMIGNQKVVQAFGQEDEVLERFDEINERLGKCSLKAIFFSSTTNPATRFVNSLVYTGVGLTGAISAISGGITVGQLSCFLSYANQYTKPFNEISGVVTELQNALACAARIFELIEEEPQIAEAENAAVLKEVDGTVALKDVYFSYTPKQKLIQNFNLSVKQGQRVAIVGPTGCGKTTVINLLMRFYDVNSGSVRVDGRDVREYTPKELREKFAVVFQNDTVFHDSIMENICFGREIGEEEVMAAAKDACAYDFIMEKEDGFLSEAAIGGANLSGGQKQRLLITRALAGKPEILVLDDSSSALDYKTDAKLRRAIRKHYAGTNIVMVAQRVSSLMGLDHILVLEDGEAIGYGRHEELLKDCEVYREIYEVQMGSMEGMAQ